MPDHEQKFRIDWVEQYSGMPRPAILRAVKSNPPRLTAYAAGPFGPYYFTKSDVDAWLASMKITAAATNDESGKVGAK